MAYKSGDKGPNSRHYVVAIAMLTAAAGFISCTNQPAERTANASQVSRQAPSPHTSAAATPGIVKPDNVAVYYFHGTRRCRTCLKMQETISTAIRRKFADETESGVLTFREVNFESPENRHYAKTYNLGYSTLVVAARKGESNVTWSNFDRIWRLAQDPPALAEYTEAQVRAYLALLERGR